MTATAKNMEAVTEISPDAEATIRLSVDMPELEFLQKSGHIARQLKIPVGRLRAIVERRRKEHAAEAAAKAKANGHAANGHADEEPDDGAEPKLPPGYYENERGVWLRSDDEEKPDTFLCAPLEFIAETRGEDGNNWGVLLRWKDHDDREHEWPLPRLMLAGDGNEYRRALLDQGLHIAPGKKARDGLTSLLTSIRRKARVRAVTRVGWHGPLYVMPDCAYGGSEGERVLLQTESRNNHAFKTAGTLEGWQDEVARYAEGNSRLAIALSAAFAPPLLSLVGAESGGIHLRGASSIGKSTALEMAGSVWGGGGVKGYVRQWRATANGLEGVAASHCDALLCLDELSQVDARDAGATAYMLANGQGKTRASREGMARAAAEWRLLFMSTGEISLADKAIEDGRTRKTTAGQQVRILDIPADAGARMGVFEELHGIESADVLARHLKAGVQVHYGHAAAVYLDKIVRRRDAIAASVTPCRDEFVGRVCPAGVDGQVTRAALRFGLIAAAGELAISLGILPLPEGAAIAAAETCFTAWRAERGTDGPAEIEAGIGQVRRFLELHGESRFGWMHDDDKRTAPIINRAGFRKLSLDNETEYLVLPEVWRSEMCAGCDAKLIARVLAERGMLKTQGDRLQINARLPGMGTARVYHVTATILQGGDRE